MAAPDGRADERTAPEPLSGAAGLALCVGVTAIQVDGKAISDHGIAEISARDAAFGQVAAVSIALEIGARHDSSCDQTGEMGFGLTAARPSCIRLPALLRALRGVNAD